MKKIVKYYWPMLLGTAVCLLLLYILKIKGEILDQAVISNMMGKIIQEEKIQRDYLFYLIKLRGSQIGLLLCMRLMKKEKLGLMIWLWLTGIGMGVGAFYFVTLYQIWGLLFLFGLLFPHYYLYLFAYYKYRTIDLYGQKHTEKTRKKGVYIVKKLALALVVIIGLVSEYYVNPFIVNFFKKIIFIKNYNI